MSFSVAAVFSSNMVLQRDKVIRVFGEGEEGAVVSATLCVGGLGYTGDGVVRAGRWEIELPPQPAVEDATLTITCGDEEKVMTNIAVGEVWLLGGQSNMEMELQNIKDGRKHLQEDRCPNVRYYYTQKNGYMNEAFYEKERHMVWKEFSPEAAACWSGVGYLFGKQLSEHLGVTVGLIGCNWGGTSASAWMSKESILAEDDLKIYWEEYEERIKGRSAKEQEREYREYEEYQREWDIRAAKYYAVTPDISWDEIQKLCGKNYWPGPMNICNPYRPTALYHAMIQRVAPYSMRGFLFYQGESDDHRPNTYERLLKRMIGDWRSEWREPDMPFVFVQLPMHRYAADPDYKHWCGIREAQLRVYQTVKNTGMAVAIDCGEFNEIHPKDKGPVAHRLYLQTLLHVYGELTPAEANAPIFRESYRDGDALRLTFSYAQKGFVTKTDVSQKPLGFEIAGEDEVYYPAEVTICGEEILLKAPEVAKPVSARYLWTNYGPVNLYGANGIPVAPFRTVETANRSAAVQTEIRQVMEL